MTSENQIDIERELLIRKIENKELRLSYSTLKNFTSPINLINYKLKPFKKSPSMVFGSLCDVLLLTPQNFEKEYVITDKIPTTDMQIDFCDELVNIGKNKELTDEIIEVAFNNYYKRGSYEKTFEPLKDYIHAKINSKEVITQSMYDEAKSLIDNLLRQSEVAEMFMQISDVQKKVEWKDNKWNFVGYLDMLLNNNHIVDLKFSKDANPDKFERDIANYDYFLQAGMYCYALKELGITNLPKFSFLVFDKSYNYSIIELDYSYIKYGERKYKYLLDNLDKMIDKKQYHKSYNFFKTAICYKPKWAKGYELKE